MGKKIILFCLILFSSSLLAQTTQSVNIPIQELYSNLVRIKDVYFNKRIHNTGRGEVLEVEIIFENLTDDPKDVYVNVIATYEKEEKTKSSFEMPIPEKERIRNFVPFPDDIANYEHPDQQGVKRLKAYPKNTTTGINPFTNTLYRLPVDLKFVVRSTHLSRYRKNYVFFNYATIIVFNKEGVPILREVYELRGRRR